MKKHLRKFTTPQALAIPTPPFPPVQHEGSSPLPERVAQDTEIPVPQLPVKGCGISLGGAGG